MGCGRLNRYANRTNLLSEHAQFKLSLDQTRAFIDQVQRVVNASWLPVLRQHGASDADCDRLAPAFNYPGFKLGLADVLSAGA